MKKLYIVTLPALGWNCVIGLFNANSEEEVKKELADRSGISLEEFNEWNQNVEDQHVISEITITDI